MTTETDITRSGGEGVGRIAGLVILNALAFQEVLSGQDPRVRNLATTVEEARRGKEALPVTFAIHWRWIVENIDYYPIFHLAGELLVNMSSLGEVERGFERLISRARSLVGRKAALRHDLMGRVFHRMLLEAKYLGTYYTSIPAAAMLLRTALRPRAWKTKWGDLDALSKFKVADLACGTGTLLLAAADALADNSLRASRSRGVKGLSEFHKRVHRRLAEDVIHGYDVIPSALHLTAAALAMRAPEVGFERMNMFLMPLGGERQRLGTLDFLETPQLSFDDLFGAAPTAVTGRGTRDAPNVELPLLNLVAINPPFTRSVGGNLLFGSIPEKRRAAMQKRLKDLVLRRKIRASVTAGLGSVFVALADARMVPGGRMALVLPKTLLNGPAWAPTRELLAKEYVVEHVFCSHDPERWNFSESTDLSETMVIARKRENRNGEKPNGEKRDSGERTLFVNLHRNPVNYFEALAVTHGLDREPPEEIRMGRGPATIRLGKSSLGNVVALDWDLLRATRSLFDGAAFAQADLIRVAIELREGRLRPPGTKKWREVPVVPLAELGAFGPDRRDIHDAFRRSSSRTAFRCLWGRGAEETRTLQLESNAWLEALPRAKPRRPLRKAEDIWPLAGDILIAERLRMNTQSLLAAFTPKPLLANMWWTFRPKRLDKARARVLVAWMNSTLGVLLATACRQETHGAWIAFKKPTLAALRVLDPRALSDEQVEGIAKVVQEVAREPLAPFPRMDEDPVRRRLDEAFEKSLDLPDLALLREMLAHEPFICLKRL